MMAHLMLEAALSCFRRGWSVIPLIPRGKRPLVRWAPYQRIRADEAKLTAWFRRWPEANLGIVTGEISGLVVLDVDPAHGGGESLTRLEAETGPLPRTAQALSGGGGRHFYFSHPRQPSPNRAGVRPGLDLRGDGGYVTAPPSVHPSGRPYAWVVSPDEAPLAPLPAWLMMPASDAATAPRGHSTAYWRGLIRGGVTEGARNSTIASLAGHLLHHGVHPQIVRELLLCWNETRCRPPLDPQEVASVIDSIVRTRARHQDDALAPAGDNGGPAEPG